MKGTPQLDTTATGAGRERGSARVGGVMIIYEEKQLLDFLVSTNRFVAPFEDVKPSIFSTGIFQSVFIDGKHLVMLKKDFAFFIESIKPICFDDKAEMEAFTNRA